MNVFKKLLLLPLLIAQLYADTQNLEQAALTATPKSNELNTTNVTAKIDAQSFRTGMIQEAKKYGPHVEKFVKIYGLSGEMLNAVVNYLNTNGDNIAQNIDYEKVFYLSGSNIYIKNDLTRLLNAIRLKQCIEKNNLYLLDVAQKQVGCIKGKWYVFAKKVERGEHADVMKITLELIKQLIIVAEETGYSDWHYDMGKNWIWDDNGKLVCIDTENLSFSNKNYTAKNYYTNDIATASPACKLNFVSTLKAWRPYMEEDAKAYFDRYLENLDPLTKTMSTHYLPSNATFDPKGINLEKVKAEYIEYATAQAKQ